jgi:hypothetical protein
MLSKRSTAGFVRLGGVEVPIALPRPWLGYAVCSARALQWRTFACSSGQEATGLEPATFGFGDSR